MDGTTTSHVTVERLGRREYGEVHALQQRLQQERIDGGADRLLLVEHDPVLTLGRAHPEPKLRVAAPMLQAAGIPVAQTERGGDITYHGPGQLVAYCIIGLRDRGLSATDLVAGLEDCAIAVAKEFGVCAARDSRNRGAWVDGRKLASIGINVRRGVSMHGIALNVDPDMEHFALIQPCGLDGVEMTSLRLESGAAPGLPEVEDAFVRAFATVFDCKVEATEPLAPPVK